MLSNINVKIQLSVHVVHAPVNRGPSLRRKVFDLVREGAFASVRAEI